MKKSKVLTLLLALTIILTCMSLYISANYTPTIVVSSDENFPGNTVDVTISLENNPGIISMLLDVTYDADVMTLISVTDAGNLGTQAHNNNYKLNPYVLYWYNPDATENITNNGLVATLTFRLNEDATGGEYPITVSYDNKNDAIFDIDFTPIEFNITNSSVTVTPIEYTQYEVVYVESALESINYGSAEEVYLKNGNPETNYYRYEADGEAYRLYTFRNIDRIFVDEIYCQAFPDNKLVPGVYLINNDNIVVDHVEAADIQSTNTLKTGELLFTFYVKKIKPSEIDLYTYDYIRFNVDDADLSSINDSTGIESILFTLFENDGEKTYQVQKSDTQLLSYLRKNFFNPKTGDEIAVDVLVAPNYHYKFDHNKSFPHNKFRGVVYNHVVDKADDAYIINYNANGGTGGPEAQITMLGLQSEISNKIPSKPGFTFLGWSTDRNGEVEYESGYSYLGNTSITLYAIWAPLLGDVDNDGKISSVDVIKLARHLADWTGYENINTTNADVNGDGEITVADSTILARHWAGWIRYQTLPFVE